MDDDTLVTRLESLVEAEVDGELMGLSIEHGTCFGFNESATAIWRMLATPQTLAQICDALMQQYEVERAACRADLSVALNDMTARGLVALTPAA